VILGWNSNNCSWRRKNGHKNGAKDSPGVSGKSLSKWGNSTIREKEGLHDWLRGCGLGGGISLWERCQEGEEIACFSKQKPLIKAG